MKAQIENKNELESETDMIMNTFTPIPYDPVAVDPVNPMGVLLVEDSQADADRVLDELRRAGIHPVCVQVATAAKLEAALGSMLWDVILCANRLEHLGARAALELVRRNRVDAPFIVLADPDSEPGNALISPAEVDAFIPRNCLPRLAPAVERLVERARHHAAEQAECKAAAESSDFSNDESDRWQFETTVVIRLAVERPLLSSIHVGAFRSPVANALAA